MQKTTLLATVNATLRIKLLNTLDECQFNILEALTRTDLENILQETTPDLIIMDLFFRDGDTLEIAKKIKDKKTAIIGISNLLHGYALRHYLVNNLNFIDIFDTNTSPRMISMLIKDFNNNPQKLIEKKRNLLTYQTNKKRIQKLHSLDAIENNNPDARTSSELNIEPDNTPLPNFKDYRVPTAPDYNKVRTLKSSRQKKINLYGNLKTTPLLAILWQAYKKKFNKTLLISSLNNTITITFKKGLPCNISSNWPDATFFNYLFEKLKLTPELKSRLMTISQTTGQSKEDLLIDLGVISQKDSLAYRKEHFINILEDLFQLEDAYFFFLNTAETHNCIEFDDKDFRQLLITAVFEKIPIYKIIDNLKNILPFSISLNVDIKTIAPFALKPEIMHIAKALINGATLIEMIVHFPANYPIHQVIYLLLILGFVELENH